MKWVLFRLGIYFAATALIGWGLWEIGEAFFWCWLGIHIGIWLTVGTMALAALSIAADE